MASTYGVSYGGAKKQPVRFGTVDSRSSLSNLMQPMTSIRPNGAGYAAINAAAPLDVIGRTVANGQNTFGAIAPASTPPPAAHATAAPIASLSGFSDTGDPILAQIKAAGQRGVQDANSGALAGAKNDLLNYGSADVPQSLRDLFASQTPTNDPLIGDLPANAILAALNDSQTAQAASANPYSTLKQLGNAHDTNVHGIDNSSNLNNLYYSSSHANALGDEQNAYLASQNQAAQNLASLLSGENNGVLSALSGAHDQYNAALPDAFNRWVAQGGTGDGTGGSGGGTGGDTGGGGSGTGTGTGTGTPLPPDPPAQAPTFIIPAATKKNALAKLIGGGGGGGFNRMI